MYRGSNSRPNVSEGYEVTSELPGRPVSSSNNNSYANSNSINSSNRWCRSSDTVINRRRIPRNTGPIS